MIATRAVSASEKGEDHVQAVQTLSSDPGQTLDAAASALLTGRGRQGAIDTLVSATKSEQAAKRLEALQLLSQTDHVDEETVLAALSGALTDKDQEVKGYAIQALADRGETNTLAPLCQAFHDPDPAIRLLVIEKVAGKDQGLLHDALADADAAVHSLASSFLQSSVSTFTPK